MILVLELTSDKKNLPNRTRMIAAHILPQHSAGTPGATSR